MRFRTSQQIFLWLGIILLMSSCRLPAEELSPLEQDIVDTLYNAALPDYRLELDSICSRNRDSLIKIKADSLVELQLQEIKKLINRK